MTRYRKRVIHHDFFTENYIYDTHTGKQLKTIDSLCNELNSMQERYIDLDRMVSQEIKDMKEKEKLCDNILNSDFEEIPFEFLLSALLGRINTISTLDKKYRKITKKQNKAAKMIADLISENNELRQNIVDTYEKGKEKKKCEYPRIYWEEP